MLPTKIWRLAKEQTFHLVWDIVNYLHKKIHIFLPKTFKHRYLAITYSGVIPLLAWPGICSTSSWSISFQFYKTFFCHSHSWQSKLEHWPHPYIYLRDHFHLAVSNTQENIYKTQVLNVAVVWRVFHHFIFTQLDFVLNSINYWVF